MPVVRVGEIEIYFETHGEGPALLLINGLGSSVEMWSPFWKRLAETHEVILFDNRGVGRSTLPTEPFSVEDMANDAAGVLTALDLPTAAVYGGSMGGQIGLALALDHPRRVRALLLGMTSCGGPKSVPTPPEVMQRMLTALNPPPGMSPHEALEVWWSVLYSPGYLAQHREQLAEEARSVRFPTLPPGYRRQAEAVLAFDVSERLPEIAIPTFVMAGTQDEIIPPENARLLAASIPGARLRLFDGAGHGFTREREAEATAEILRFLESVEGPRSPEIQAIFA